MPLLVLAAFVSVPVAEIYLLIRTGGLIGIWPTIGLIVLTALIGTALLRRQGLATLARARSEIGRNRVPVRELFDAVCLLLAGALLLTPGFLTDAVGFALLVPPFRAALGRGVWSAAARSRNARFSVRGDRTQAGPGRGPEGDGPVIDAEEFGVRREDDDDPPRSVRNP